jgi:phosphoribosylamine--glycine ligase / phosphoribosylformylglycinamidine cyclo-ligase
MLLMNEEVDLVSVMLVGVLFYNVTMSNYFQACAERHLDSVHISFKPGFAVSVVLASEGYPGSYTKGNLITFEKQPRGRIQICYSLCV